MRERLASFLLAGLAASGAVACATPATINVSVESEVPCDAGAAAVLSGGPSLTDLPMAPSASSTECVPSGGGEALLGNVVVVPVSHGDESVAFAVMTRPDGMPADGCLSAGEAPGCIVAKRQLRFIPGTELAMRVDLRLSCLGVDCPGEDTCVKGVCVPAQVPAGNCPPPCGEGVLVPADAGPPAGDSGGLDATTDAPGPLYSIGGALTGLAQGNEVVLVDYAGTNVVLTANGAFEFPMRVRAGSSYNVVPLNGQTMYNLSSGVATMPSSQGCLVSNGVGAVGTSNVTGVQIVCATYEVLTLASGQEEPDGITVDSTRVYWTNEGLGRIVSLPTGGGTPTTLASGNEPTFIQVNGTSVFWSDYAGMGPDAGRVASVPLGGGPTTTIASGLSIPFGIALDQTSIYWANVVSTAGPSVGTIVKAPLGGGAITTLATGQAFPAGVAVTGGNVYWTDAYDGKVVSVPVAGGTPTTIASVAADTTPWMIATDSRNAYWTNSFPPTDAGSVTGMVMSVPLSGGAVTTLASGQHSPEGIAADGVSVYWTNNGDGTVMSVTMPFGAPVTLASGQNQPSGIAVDATSLYWTDFGSGNVMKLTPK